jgi:hypothetical protein
VEGDELVIRGGEYCCRGDKNAGDGCIGGGDAEKMGEKLEGDAPEVMIRKGVLWMKILYLLVIWVWIIRVASLGD